MDRQAPVVVTSVSTEAEASVVKSLLDSYGIPCHFTSGLTDKIYPVPDPDSSRIKIYVSAAFAQEAKNVLNQHRRDHSPLHLVDD